MKEGLSLGLCWDWSWDYGGGEPDFLRHIVFCVNQPHWVNWPHSLFPPPCCHSAVAAAKPTSQKYLDYCLNLQASSRWHFVLLEFIFSRPLSLQTCRIYPLSFILFPLFLFKTVQDWINPHYLLYISFPEPPLPLHCFSIHLHHLSHSLAACQDLFDCIYLFSCVCCM